MKTVLIVHPIAGNVICNLVSIEAIVREINLTMPDVVPCAPYYVDCMAMDDEEPIERQRGLNNSLELIRRGAFDELWVYGSEITGGMLGEIMEAHRQGIPIIPKSSGAHNHLYEMQIEYGLVLVDHKAPAEEVIFNVW